MSKKSITDLSRRERQIMDVIFKKRTATVAEVREAMPDPPSYSSVRALLRILEDKGLLKHKQLLQRPVVVTKDKAIVGRPKDRVRELLS